MPIIIGEALALLFTGLRLLFLSRIGLWIASALLWLGINFTSVKMVIEPTANLLKGYTSGMSGAGGMYGAIAMQYAGMMNLDRAVTMIVSAYITKQAITSGRLFLFRKGVGA